MAVKSITVEMDDKIAGDLERVCNSMGLSISTLFLITAEQVVHNEGLPFEIKSDPFYRKENIAYLENISKDIKDGTAKISSHDLIEVDE